jgi:hypothetical protein
MSKISALFELRSMLREMEHEVGLHTLTPVEMDVFLAHDLTSGIAQATYHRALRSLLSLGFLEKAEGYKSTHYLVRSDLTH